MTPDEVLERLEAALRRAGGDVELSVYAARVGTARFANSRVTQTGAMEDCAVQARVALEGRVGAARTNALDEESLSRTIARAGELARGLGAAPSAATYRGFDDGKKPLPQVAPAFDAETAAADADARAALVAPGFRATAAVRQSAAGLALTSDAVYAVATSAGARRGFRTTGARLDLIASDGDASAHAACFDRSIAAVAAAAPALADDACARAAAARDPVELEPGTYDVILEPAAVAELLEWLALTSFGARAVEDGSSCLAGRTGQRIAGAVTVYDDALSGDDGCPTLPFDSEGTPKQRVSFFDGGLAAAWASDRATAGDASNGHAPPVSDEIFEGGPVPQHVHLAGGADDLPALLARVERGLWVTRFHYVNGLVDTRRAVMTGMTRDGLFLVENGALGRAVRNLRWTEPVLEALGRVDGITAARQVVAAGLSESMFVCPTVLVRGWHFTGRSR
jgi:predicted Zn-dependent protease